MKKLIVFFLLFIILEKNHCQDTSQEDVKIYYSASSNKIEFWLENDNYKLINVSCFSRVAVSTPLLLQLDNTILPVNNNNDNDKIICDNLFPCTTYDVKAFIQNQENATSEKLLRVDTAYAKPSVNFTSIIPDQLFIIVTWEAKNPRCIRSYNIRAETEGDKKETNFPNNNAIVEYKFEYLNPCSLYNITLTATDINNTILQDQGGAQTKFIEPEEIKGLQFSPYSQKNSMKVTWELPHYSTCINYYFLRWSCTSSDCVEETKTIDNSKINEYIIEHADACAVYKFTIGINQIESGVTKEFATDFLSPSSIVNYQILNDTFSNATFSWDKPKENHRCVNYYEINIIGPNQFDTPLINKTIKYYSTIYTIPEVIEPCGNYSIEMRVVTKKATYGDVYRNDFHVREETPKGIEEIKVKYIYPTEILLKFVNSTKASLCVEEYRITCSPKDNSEVKTDFFPVTNKSFIMKNLTSCMKYEVQITAVTYNKNDGISVILPVTTSARVTSKPVLDKDAKINHNSLQLRGGNEDQTNRCEILFAKFECRAQEDARISYAEEIVQPDIGVSKFTATIYPLSPLTTYDCTISLFNEAGWSSSKVRGIWKTSSYYPEMPTSIQAESLSNSIFNIKWSQPKFLNGEFPLYKIYIQSMGPAYEVPKLCKIPPSKVVNQETTKTEFNQTEAYSYSLYSIQIATSNDFATGSFSSPTFIVTKSTVSEPVEDFSILPIEIPEVNTNEYEANVTMKWLPPCQSNGIIKSFDLYILGQREGSMPIRITRTILSPFINDSGYIYWSEMIYYPEYTYTAMLTVSVHDVDESSESRLIEFDAPAGVPEKVTEPEKLSKVDSFASSNPTNSAVVKFSNKLFESKMGKIVYAAILISEMNCQKDPELKAEKYDMENGWPEIKRWKDVKDDECISQYQTTPIKWKPFSISKRMKLLSSNAIGKTEVIDDVNNKSDDEMIEYIIGAEDKCEPFTDFCNGPLKSNTKYKMILRTFTKNGYRDSVGVEFKTDEIVQFYLILLIIISVLLIAFLLGFIYLWTIKRKSWNRQSLNGVEDSTGDVSTKNFLQHYTELSAKDKVQREFKDLAVVAQDVCIASTISKYNESKNRYSNIYPYEKNRVILTVDSEGSDYINASFINGYKHRKEYIATQGPKPESFIDFWKMVLEYKVKVMVMVTQFVEENKIKCHQYYPSIVDKEIKFGNNITILCKCQTDNQIYERRELVVKHGFDEVQTVIHYLFKRWPDHDVPSDPNELIEFVKRVKSEKIPSRTPIVVHCSAGVGRTGTFIALDLIMQKIKNECKVNIYDIVKSLRFQRMKMVQSINQYQFLYNCTLEIVKKKYEKKLSNSRNIKSFFCKSNSDIFPENNQINNINGKMMNGLNGGLSMSSASIRDTKLKNNLSNNSIISNGSIKGGGHSFSSNGFSKNNSRNSFNPNDIESVM